MEQLRPKINNSTELDLETKAQLLFGLGAVVREDLLIEYVLYSIHFLFQVVPRNIFD